ncbi:MAG: hypothetical protein ACLVJH_12595 [Faecalibacterium prausnitzii]
MSENVLTIENATMQFGGVVAVDNLNLKVDKDQIVSLIGPNGAGKTHRVQRCHRRVRPPTAVWFEGTGSLNTPRQDEKLYKGQNARQVFPHYRPTPDKICQMVCPHLPEYPLWKSQTVFERALSPSTAAAR